MSTLSSVPGCTSSVENSEFITIISRNILDGKGGQSQDQQCSTIFSRLLQVGMSSLTVLSYFLFLSQSLLFRVRQMHPCIISNVSFEVNLPEDDEIQVHVG